MDDGRVKSTTQLIRYEPASTPVLQESTFAASQAASVQHGHFLMNELTSYAVRIMAICAISFVIANSVLAAEKVEFNRDIRPILSDKCFICHGPDSAKRKGDLRLDRREAAIAVRDDNAAIVPGKSVASELIRRVSTSDVDLQMPPADSNLKLTPAEIQLLKRWIDEGAEYQAHWSFLPPRSSALPSTRQASSARNPIDTFIRARLDTEGMSAAVEADRVTLLRRVCFDLTGLPPTPAEVDEFVADKSPDAFEKVVDRLLASPRYGERMAIQWLDAARYADTNGYQTDGPRFMWRWRDWVIDAFNQNQPFDEFTIDQLAGDLVEEQSRSNAAIANARLIATGFNRNHRGNAEGGIIPEEFRIEYVVDRVETTGTVWLGLTIGCARCHDHKYDPINQREFYQLFAFFNQVPEPGKYIRNDNSMPYLPAPTADQQRQLTTLDLDRQSAEKAWLAVSPDVDAGMKSLADTIRRKSVSDWSFTDSLDTHISFDEQAGVGVRSKASPEGLVNQPLTWKPASAGKPVAGRIGSSMSFDGSGWIETLEGGDFGEEESFAISVWVKPAGTSAMTILARMDHDNSSRGYELRREANGRLQVLFSGRILDDLIRIETKLPIPADQWSHLLVSYDGSSAARGVTLRINGEIAETTVITDLLSNPFRVKLPLGVGGRGSAAPFIGLIDELRCYRGHLTDEAAQSLAAGDSISQIASRWSDSTISAAGRQKFREFYLAEHAPDSHRAARQKLLDARKRYAAYLATIPTTMVMQDRIPRPTHMLKRGEYDKPGEQVEAAIPVAITAATIKSEAGRRLNRLDLARWLVAPENPLTARVTVNRLWQSLFGVGIVKTAEDFGTQGEAPSHPELLDWLALEFSGFHTDRVAGTLRSHGRWDLKRTMRQIVTSATYRQSSQTSPAVLARDPDNRWLARGPRFRLPAEAIRDSILATSNLLVENVGGPSVKPYQPQGLWEELSADAVPGPFSIYVQDHGPNLYRRGVYTYRRRTVPPPSLAIFDASPREACRVSLPRTNTPLQALNLMNDVTYIEAARVLAEKAMKEGGASAPSRLAWTFRQILSREPSEHELKLLVDGFERRRQAYESRKVDAEKLLKLGEIPYDSSLVPTELAAFTATTSLIYNLDEFVAKP